MRAADLVEIIAPAVGFGESFYEAGGKRWPAELLYKQADLEGAEPYRLKLRDIDFGAEPWGEDNRLGCHCYHMRRAVNADLGIPVLVGPLGGIMDGYHRIMRALVEGRSYVMAIRLKELPEPEECNGDET